MPIETPCESTNVETACLVAEDGTHVCTLYSGHRTRHTCKCNKRWKVEGQ